MTQRLAVVSPDAPREALATGRNQWVLGGLVLLGLVLIGALVYPFASALLCAAVLAGIFHPTQERLAARLHGHRQLAAGLLSLAVALVLVLPTVFVATHLVQQIGDGVGYVERTLRTGGMPALIDNLPGPLQKVARRAVEGLPGGGSRIESLAENHGGTAAAAVRGLLSATTRTLISVALMLVALFFLLVDGRRLVGWLAGVVPLPPGYTIEILRNFRSVSLAVVVSSLATAGIQSLAALVGYVLVGVPQPAFFAFVTFLFGFIPLVGASSVVMALSGFYLLTGNPHAALFLGLWGVLVVSVIDNIVKPLLLKGRMEVHGAVIFFALLGGMASFGPVGLLAGPLILSFFLAVIRLYAHGPQPAA